ncbi:MAG: glycoside hydrolase family 2 TIM barrel-domain containing protein [Verrucomicrobiota bacterium]
MSIIDSDTSKLIELRKEVGRFSLYVEGERYYIKGAGGTDYLPELVACGGNTLRTWHCEQTDEILDEAGDLGLLVCAGLDLAPARQGFDYRNPLLVEEQNARMLEYVAKRKDHPAIMMWGVGNELELNFEDDGVWDVVEDLAERIKKIDPTHLLMTVVAAVNKEVIETIAQRCPSIDVLGINAYKALDEVAPRLRETSWSKPYIVTEWGGDGAWEVASTHWGAEIEPPSMFKAEKRMSRYAKMQTESRLCLGSFAFLWGQKQEVTPTWYNIFDEKGRPFECMNAMRLLWGGEDTGTHWPRIEEIQVNGFLAEDELEVEASSVLEARIRFAGLGSGSLDLSWELMEESQDKREGGDAQSTPKRFQVEPLEETFGSITFKAPSVEGGYRIFAYAICDRARVAAANFPFWVKERK